MPVEEIVGQTVDRRQRPSDSGVNREGESEEREISEALGLDESFWALDARPLAAEPGLSG